MPPRILTCVASFLLAVSALVAAASTSPPSLCAVTAYFNPLHYSTRLVNFVEARQWSRRQGVFLVVVELGFGDDGFELDQHVVEDELTRIVRVRTGRENVLWHKEALLNVGLKALNGYQEGCEHIAWLDSDILLEDGWMEAAEEMLTSHSIGQVFTHLVRLPQGVFSPFAFWSEPRMQRMGVGKREGQVQVAAALGFGGHTGFAWAARKEFLNEMGGLYDHCIVGGFDFLLFHALNDPRCEDRLTSMMQDDFEHWSARLGTERAGVPSRTIKAAALWHGDLKDRTYQDRHAILLKHGFDPRRHVRLDEQGVLGWTSEAGCALKRNVLEMFLQRQEDGQNVGVSEEVTAGFPQLGEDNQCDSDVVLT